MHARPTRTALLVTFLSGIAALACGGEVAGEPDDDGGAVSDPRDISDPRFLPPGTYEMSAAVATCDVNARLPSGADVATRNGLRMNVPIPLRLNGVWAAGRQDLALDVRRREVLSESDVRCPGGKVRHLLEITDLSATRITLRRTEEMIDCSVSTVPSCTVESTLTLVESACRPPGDPACVTEDVYRTGNVRTDVRCVCDR